MNKQVLVIADIEDNDKLSLEKAREIALPMSATLEIVKFIQHTADSELTLEQHIEDAKQSLNSNIQSIFADAKAIKSEVVVSNNIADWVVKRCEQKAVDLVIKGGHRTESLFHTPSDWKLIRHLQCPILIASHAKWKSKSNILLALDLSAKDKNHQKLNALVLAWGETLSKGAQNKLHAMYSIPIAKPLLEFDVVSKHSVEMKKAPEMEVKMQELLERFDMSDVPSHICAGPPDKNIPHQASKLKSDLVIIGSVGREGLSGLLLGNIAEKVLHHLHTDCLIVKLPLD